MGNRRDSSSNYPNKPHKDKKKGSGERSRSQREGHFGRDGNKSGSTTGRHEKTARVKKRYEDKDSKHSGAKVPRIVSENQILDGRYKGIELKISPSPKMRPTSAKLREALFRILYRRIRANRFLDLCAGAGTVGIGAISRGALISTMVERKAKNITLIKENLERIGVSEGHGEVIEQEYQAFLTQMSKKRRFWDVVYFGPSYDCDYEEALTYFERGMSIRPGGILVIEHPAELFLPPRRGVLKRWKVVTEDEGALSFFDRVS